MEKTIETKWNELWPIVNILNEVCHGIDINDFENEIGFKYEVIFALLRKIAAYEMEEDKSEIKTTIELNDVEVDVIIKCCNEVLKQIEEWEFSTRIGVSIKEASKIKERLTSQFQ
jgi:uncharacterized protein YqgV (UPF0045/DUF77 family)